MRSWLGMVPLRRHSLMARPSSPSRVMGVPFTSSTSSSRIHTFFSTLTTSCGATSVWNLWHSGADPDPYLWIIYTDTNPTPHPTPFFSDFKDAKEKFSRFFYNISVNTLSSSLKIKFLLRFFVKILFWKHFLPLSFVAVFGSGFRDG